VTGSAVAYVVSLNLHRRHLTTSQRALVAARISGLSQGRPWARIPYPESEVIAQTCAFTQDEAGDLLNVSCRSVQKARAVREADPKLAAKRCGFSSATTAENAAKVAERAGVG